MQAVSEAGMVIIIPFILPAAKLNTSFVACIQGIGLTKEKNLRGEDKATYKALATSSARYKDKVQITTRNGMISTQYGWGFRGKNTSDYCTQRRFASDGIESDLSVADTTVRVS